VDRVSDVGLVRRERHPQASQLNVIEYVAVSYQLSVIKIY